MIGAFFGLLVGNRVHSTATALGWGAMWGVLWWVLGGPVLMPILLGMKPFVALEMAPMRPVAMGSLVGHLLDGMILGRLFAHLRRSAPVLAGT